MNDKLEYDSEFCNVRYLKDENAVLLAWKKFARSDDYRRPALFALELLKQHPHSSFIVDATNGFEDGKEDVTWGFSELLPSMAKTDCEYIVFITKKKEELEEEISLWTKEFEKYFTVFQANSLAQAMEIILGRILVNVRYTMKPGKRGEFLAKANELGILSASKAEPGNKQYEYFIPLHSEDELFLMELWANSKALSAHGQTGHYQQLQALKKEYVAAVAIEKYNVSPIL